LSPFFTRSGPTIGVGLMITFHVASLSFSVWNNHRFCSAPQIVFFGPSVIVFGERKSRPSVSHTCRYLPQRKVR
jgi:hypothetical protein